MAALAHLGSGRRARHASVASPASPVVQPRPAIDPAIWHDASRRVAAAVEALTANRPLLLRDDVADLESGWVLGAAATCSDSFVNFMVRRAGGLVSVALGEDRADALGLEPMVTAGRGRRDSSFAISVEARHGVSTGISTSDRALTVRALGNPLAGRFDFTQPGHVFPVRARSGGVRDVLGWPEAAVDLARLADLPLAAVAACQVMTKSGATAGGGALTRFARTHELPVISVSDVFVERLRREPGVQPASDTAMPTAWGIFRAGSYVNAVDGSQHLALVRGDVAGAAVSVHVHERCLPADALGSSGCDCRSRLDSSLEMMATDECGVLVYLDAGGPAPRADRPERLATITRWGAAADIVRVLGIERAWATGDAGVDAMLEAFGVAVLPNPQLAARERRRR